MSIEKIRFLVVDDHPLIRQAVSYMLCAAYSDSSVIEAASAEAAQAHLKDGHFDLMLLDINLPGMGGLELLDRIVRTHPALLLTMHDESQFALRALQIGARGYITKEHAQESLLAAVRKVLAGGRWISDGTAEILAANAGAPLDRPAHDRLSPRELRVLTLLGAGVTVTDIAVQLHLSSKTVSTFRARILQKLAMKTNADLTRYCLDHKLLA